MSLVFQAEDRRAWQEVLEICRDVAEAGGVAHLVGGSVRDAFLGLQLVDFDLEVFGIEADALRALLAQRYRIDLVGEAFGVLKIRGLPIDVALPRRESKIGAGHRAFEVQSDPAMSFAEAARRRDFTINSIAYDPLREALIDPFDGASDIASRTLRHTSEQFVEDPLRVLRGMQLVSRFGLTVPHETIRMCRSIGLEGLAPERVFEEWRKLLLLGSRPRLGLEFLLASGWLRHYPELADLVGCPQDYEWHPEGDVWIHTLWVLDAFATDRVGEPWEDLVVGLACLCHDLGKPATTRFERGRWRSLGHEQAGEVPTRSLMARFSRQEELVEQVVPLVLHHLKPRQLHQAGAGDAALRRLARKVGRIDRLVRVARADTGGRPPLPAGFPAGDWLLERAKRLAVVDRAPPRLVLGRHLIACGLEPGPHFRPLLDRCYEAQLDGQFGEIEGGLRYLEQLLVECSEGPKGTSVEPGQSNC